MCFIISGKWQKLCVGLQDALAKGIQKETKTAPWNTSLVMEIKSMLHFFNQIKMTNCKKNYYD